jgi:hypothetical protein
MKNSSNTARLIKSGNKAFNLGSPVGDLYNSGGLAGYEEELKAKVRTVPPRLVQALYETG